MAELQGDFIKIQRTTIRISEIISIKPVSIVSFNFQGEVIGRDYPKIVVTTNHGETEFLYSTQENRDKELTDVQEKINSYNVRNQNDSGNKTTINISDSSGVNVVSSSENVTISQVQKQSASDVIKRMQDELAKTSEISQEIREDIFAALTDFEKQLNENREIKRYSFKSLLGLTSDIASLTGLAISLGQILGYIAQ